MGSKSTDATLSPFAFETITVNTAIGFTVATITNTRSETAIKAVVTVETAQIRYRVDGENPSSTVGHVLDDGDVLVLQGESEILDFRAIKTTGTNGKIQCTFYE